MGAVAATVGDLATLDARVIVALGGNRADGLATQTLQIAAEVLAQLRVTQGELDGGLQIAELAAAVVALAGKAVGIHGLFLHECRNAVGELNLTARALADLLQVLEN